MDRRRHVQTDEGGRDGPDVSLSRRKLVSLAPIVTTALSGCGGLWGEPESEPAGSDDAASAPPTTYGYGGTPASGDAGEGSRDDTSTTTALPTTVATTPVTSGTSATTAQDDYGEQGYGQYGYGGGA